MITRAWAGCFIKLLVPICITCFLHIILLLMKTNLIRSHKNGENLSSILAMGSAPSHILYLVPCRHYNPSISTSSSQCRNVQHDCTKTSTAKTTTCEIGQEHIFFKTNERKRVCIFHHYLFTSRFFRVGHTTESKGAHLKTSPQYDGQVLDICIHK